jgi:hypothetical protein
VNICDTFFCACVIAFRSIAMVEVTFLEDRHDPDHRPHHIFRCVLSAAGCAPVHCVAKENDHFEGEKLAGLHFTAFRAWLPSFHGIHACEDGAEYLLIADVRAGFRAPCVADFKIGTRQWDLVIAAEFLASLRAKCAASTSRALGLRLVSMTLRRAGAVVRETTKSENLELSEAALAAEIALFVPAPLRPRVLAKLEGMRACYLAMLAAYPRMRWYSGSILVAYDGDDLAADPRVVLIDLAHFHWDVTADGGDAGSPEFDDGIPLAFETFVRMLGSCVARGADPV